MMEEKVNLNQQGESSTEIGTEVKVKTELRPDDWLCIACNKKITSDKERFEYDNQSEFHLLTRADFTLIL